MWIYVDYALLNIAAYCHTVTDCNKYILRRLDKYDLFVYIPRESSDSLDNENMDYVNNYWDYICTYTYFRSKLLALVVCLIYNAMLHDKAYIQIGEMNQMRLLRMTSKTIMP